MLTVSIVKMALTSSVTNQLIESIALKKLHAIEMIGSICYDKAESKIMFVCPRPPDPQFTPRLKKLYCVFAGEKYFYRLPPKRLIACQESGFNHTC